MKRLIAGLFLATSLILAVPSPAHAAFVFTISQVGNDVQIAGAGSLNFVGRTPVGPGVNEPAAEIIPSQGWLLNGISSTPATSIYYNLGSQGALVFGSGSTTVATSEFGDYVGLFSYNGAGGIYQKGLFLSSTYVLGTPLLNSSTYANTTLTSLGVTPGSYTVSWGIDSLTINVVPEPSTWVLFAVGGAVLAGYFLSHRRDVRVR